MTARHPAWLLFFLSLGIVSLAAWPAPALANCTSAPVFHGFTSSFESCGPNAAAFVWAHGRGVQRIVASDANRSQASIAGHDSGINQLLSQGMMIDGPNGATNGSYFGDTDWANGGYDGCVLNASLVDSSQIGCSGFPDFGVSDYAIAGVDPSQPNVARVAVLSVDFSPFFGGFVLDHAGAPAVDGDPCGGDAFSGFPGPVNCAPIPVPQILTSNPTAGGTLVGLGIGDVSGVAILDDCAIAESKTINCPRNLYAGRMLMFKRGACDGSASDAFDRRVFIYPLTPPPPPTFQAIAPNWNVFSREDGNLNGLLDAGEDGSNGGVVDGALDPFIVPGQAATTVMATVPAIAGAADCLYFGLTLALDANHLFVDSLTDAIRGETVLAPMVSVNATPVSLTPDTAPRDQVISITTSRSGSQILVEWETDREFATLGFNVVAAKKNGGGGTVLNRALIPAQAGTTGGGGSYSFGFDRSRLKGSALLFIELIKLDGTKARFGPATL